MARKKPPMPLTGPSRPPQKGGSRAPGKPPHPITGPLRDPNSKSVAQQQDEKIRPVSRPASKKVSQQQAAKLDQRKQIPNRRAPAPPARIASARTRRSK